MSLNGVPPANSGPQTDSNQQIRQGERLSADIIRTEGENATVRMKGAEYNVRVSGAMPGEGQVKLEILKSAPQIEVRVLPDNQKIDPALIKLTGSGSLPAGSNVNVIVVQTDKGAFLVRIGGQLFSASLPQELANSGTFSARVVSENPLLLMPDKGFVSVKSELMQLFQKDLSALANEIGGKLSTISAGELRQLIRNSGLFLENKLLNNQPVAGDAKLNAGIQQNQQAWDGITKMQLASILLDDGFFSFFELDELADDGIIRVRKDTYGASLHIKMNFTKLGDTVINIVPLHGGSYSARVCTADDISRELAKINVKGVTVKWAKLAGKDTELFDIKGSIVGKLGRFDIVV